MATRKKSAPKKQATQPAVHRDKATGRMVSAPKEGATGSTVSPGGTLAKMKDKKKKEQAEEPHFKKDLRRASVRKIAIAVANKHAGLLKRLAE